MNDLYRKLERNLEKQKQEALNLISFLKDKLDEAERGLSGSSTLNSLGAVQSTGPALDRVIGLYCQTKELLELAAKKGQ